MSVYKRVLWSFGHISLLSSLAQLLFIPLALKIVDTGLEPQNPRCATPEMAMFFLAVIMLIVLLLTIATQTAFKQLRNKNKSDNGDAAIN
jgi:hypothetical protein